MGSFRRFVLGLCFTAASIAQTLLFPGSVETLDLLPAPNFGAPGVDARNFLRIASNPFDNNQYDIRAISPTHRYREIVATAFEGSPVPTGQFRS